MKLTPSTGFSSGGSGNILGTKGIGDIFKMLVEFEKEIKRVESLIVRTEPHPVGCIYVSSDGTDPGQLFGGTWAVFGAGRVLVSYASGDADFGTPGGLSGSKILTVTDGHPSLTEVVPSGTGTGVTVAGQTHHHTHSGSNLQPGITVYMWERTA
jgi:hypothetical protein